MMISAAPNFAPEGGLGGVIETVAMGVADELALAMEGRG